MYTDPVCWAPAAEDSRYASLAGDAVGTIRGQDKRRGFREVVPSRCGSGVGVARLPRYGSSAAEAAGRSVAAAAETVPMDAETAEQ